MSARQQALEAIKSLKVRAAAGDPRAQAQLASLVQRAQTQIALRHRQEGARHGHDGLEYEEDEIARYERIRHELGPGVDDLAHKAALRGHKWGGLDDVAKFVRTMPPSALQGTLGNSASPTSGGQLITVAKWEGEVVDAVPVTVTLNTPAPPSQAAAASMSLETRPFGRIQWGNRGFLAQADVDIGMGGTQLTVVASSVIVQVGVDARDSAGDAQNTDYQMTIAGMLGFYPCVRTAPIFRTVYIKAADSANINFLIPSFAKRFWILRSTAGDAITATLQQTGLANVGTFVLAANTFQVEPCPIPNDAAEMQITGGTGRVRVIFELGL